MCERNKFDCNSHSFVAAAFLCVCEKGNIQFAQPNRKECRRQIRKDDILIAYFRYVCQLSFVPPFPLAALSLPSISIISDSLLFLDLYVRSVCLCINCRICIILFLFVSFSLFLFEQVLDLFFARLVIPSHRPLNWRKTAINIRWLRRRHSRIRKFRLNWARNSMKRPWTDAPSRALWRWMATNWFKSRAANQHAKLSVSSTKRRWWPRWR